VVQEEIKTFKFQDQNVDDGKGRGKLDFQTLFGYHYIQNMTSILKCKIAAGKLDVTSTF
jgi:hypothetical protein